MVEGPGPGRRDSGGIEVPALASGDPNRVLCRLHPIRLPARRRLGFGTDLAALTICYTLNQLHDIGELELGDLNEREVPDRAVRTIQHEQVGKVGHRYGEVGDRVRRPAFIEIDPISPDDL